MLLSRSITGWRLAVAMVALAGLYFGAAMLGLSLASIAPQVTPVWPPTGIALAALVLVGVRLWPGVAIGALAANYLTQLTLPIAAGVATGNTLEAVVGALLLRRVGFSPGLDRARDVLYLATLGAIVSTLVSATVGAASLCLGGRPWSAFGPIWWTWWLGDAMGDMVAAPVLLVFGSGAWRFPRERWRESVAYPLVLALVCAATLFPPWSIRGQLIYLFAPVFAWSATRLGRGFTSASLAAVAALCVWRATRTPDFFGAGSLNQRLLLLQTFMGALSGASLVLAAASAQRRRAEDSLRASEARLRIALESGNMGTWEWDIASGRVTWSPGLERIHGLGPGSFPGTFDAVLAGAHPDDRDRLRRTIARAVQHRTDHRVEYRIVLPDQSPRWLEGRGRLVTDAKGEPVRMVGVCADITDRKAAEEGLRLANIELRRKNREMEEFVYTVSHDLKSPLVTISNTAGMLRDEGLRASPEAGRLVESIEAASVGLHQRIDGLLELSRLGRTSRSWAPVRTRDVVESALRTHEQALSGASVHISDPLPVVSGDVQLIERAVDNLISNAIKHGRIDGRLNIHIHPGPDARLPQVRVADRGPGIDARFHQRIFGLFTRLSDTTDGSGVGLALVQRVMEVHGGRAWVESAPGRGAEFILEFPKAE